MIDELFECEEQGSFNQSRNYFIIFSKLKAGGRRLLMCNER